MDIQIESQPFTEKELKNIKQGLDSGKIRRFGAVVDHQKLKYSYNALIAWRRQFLNKSLTKKLKSKCYISHIYLRKPHRLWPFGLYTMIHASSKKELDSNIEELSRLLDDSQFKILNTLKEFKKISFNPSLWIT